MVLSRLGEILGVEFRDGIDVSYLNLRAIEDEDRLQKEGDILHLNLEKLEEREVRSVLELCEEQFEDEGRILRIDEEEQTAAMQRGYDDDDDEVLKFFENYLSDNILAIIEKSLFLRGLIEEEDLTKDEIQQRKRQIARRHGSNAIYLSSLVSAGYFDPDGGLRDIFVNLGLNPGYNKYDFQEILQEYAKKELLCVFVENDETVYDVKQEVRGHLARYQREEPIQEWFDIRGIGDGCANIIDGVMNELEDEFIGIDYDRWRNEDDLWVRIYPRSLQPIST